MLACPPSFNTFPALPLIFIVEPSDKDNSCSVALNPVILQLGFIANVANVSLTSSIPVIPYLSSSGAKTLLYFPCFNAPVKSYPPLFELSTIEFLYFGLTKSDLFCSNSLASLCSRLTVLSPKILSVSKLYTSERPPAMVAPILLPCKPKDLPSLVPITPLPAEKAPLRFSAFAPTLPPSIAPIAIAPASL